MPVIPQSVVSVTGLPPLRPSDAPFRASQGLSNLLLAMVQLSQRRQTVGQNIIASIGHSEVEVSTEPWRELAIVSTINTSTDNPQGSLNQRLSQSLVDVLSDNFGVFEFNEGQITSTVLVGTNDLDRLLSNELPQSRVDTYTTIPVGNQLILMDIPQSRIDASTFLFTREKSNRITQSYVEVGTLNLQAPSITTALRTTSVRVQTYLPVSQICTNVFNAGATPENTDYGLIWKADNYINQNTAFLHSRARSTKTFSFSSSVSVNSNGNISISFREVVTFSVSSALPEAIVNNMQHYRFLLKRGNSIVSLGPFRDRNPDSQSRNSFISTMNVSQAALDFLDAIAYQQISQIPTATAFEIVLVDTRMVNIATGESCAFQTHQDIMQDIPNSTIEVYANNLNEPTFMNIPNSTVDIETQNPVAGVPLPQSRIDVEAENRFATTRQEQIQGSSVSIETDLFLTGVRKSLFNAQFPPTPQSTDYALLGNFLVSYENNRIMLPRNPNLQFSSTDSRSLSENPRIISGQLRFRLNPGSLPIGINDSDIAVMIYEGGDHPSTIESISIADYNSISNQYSITLSQGFLDALNDFDTRNVVFNMAFINTANGRFDLVTGDIFGPIPNQNRQQIIPGDTEVSVSANLLEPTIVLPDMLPSSTVEVETNLPQHFITTTNRIATSEVNVVVMRLTPEFMVDLLQSLINVETTPPETPFQGITNEIPSALINVGGIAPVGSKGVSIFDSTVTPENTNYGVLWNTQNLIVNDQSSTRNPNQHYFFQLPTGTREIKVSEDLTLNFTQAANIITISGANTYISLSMNVPDSFNFSEIANYYLLFRNGNTILTLGPMGDFRGIRSLLGLPFPSLTLRQYWSENSWTFPQTVDDGTPLDAAIVDSRKVNIMTGLIDVQVTHIDGSEDIPNAQIDVSTDLPMSTSGSIGIIPNAQVDVSTNLLETGVLIPQSRVEIETQSLIKTITQTPQGSTINVETSNFMGVQFRSIFDDSVTAANSNYAVLGKVVNSNVATQNRNYVVSSSFPVDFEVGTDRQIARITFISASNKVRFGLLTTSGVFQITDFPFPANRLSDIGFIFRQNGETTTHSIFGPTQDFDVNFFQTNYEINVTSGLIGLVSTISQIDIALVDRSKTNLIVNDGTIRV